MSDQSHISCMLIFVFLSAKILVCCVGHTACLDRCVFHTWETDTHKSWAVTTEARNKIQVLTHLHHWPEPHWMELVHNSWWCHTQSAQHKRQLCLKCKGNFFVSFQPRQSLMCICCVLRQNRAHEKCTHWKALISFPLLPFPEPAPPPACSRAETLSSKFAANNPETVSFVCHLKSWLHCATCFCECWCWTVKDQENHSKIHLQDFLYWLLSSHLDPHLHSPAH